MLTGVHVNTDASACAMWSGKSAWVGWCRTSSQAFAASFGAWASERRVEPERVDDERVAGGKIASGPGTFDQDARGGHRLVGERTGGLGV